MKAENNDVKIYIIIEGEYSDWIIRGYAESEEDAMQICAKHNEDEDRREDWYYEQVEKIKSPEKKISLKYVHEFRFAKRESGYTVYDYTLHYFSAESNRAKEFVSVRKYPAGIKLDVPSTKADREHAEKIAQDALYQYLYEKESRS